ncbi:hypothetical protein BGW80DRAFT_1336313, partial [Lactifluus volemus]
EPNRLDCPGAGPALVGPRAGPAICWPLRGRASTRVALPLFPGPGPESFATGP